MRLTVNRFAREQSALIVCPSQRRADRGGRYRERSRRACERPDFDPCERPDFDQSQRIQPQRDRQFLVTATTGRVADTGHLEKDIAVQPGHLTISETIRFCGRLSAPYFR